MKSNKVKHTIGRFKERLLNFVYTEEALKAREAEKQLLEAERKELKKSRRKRLIVSTVSTFCIVAIGIAGLTILDRMNSKEETPTNIEQTVTLPEGERAKITNKEQKTYMIDRLNGIYLKIAYVEVDGQVAYSTTYNNDIIPQGEVVYTHFLITENVTTILLNGYPYVSYQEMGLENEEEAYIATQLAVYEMISRQGITNIANGTFSLEKIKASEDQYKDMVDRVIKKANELVTYAIENTYVDTSSSSFDTKSVDMVDNGNETLIGPFYTHTISDKYLDMYLGDSYEYITKFEVTSFYDTSKMYTCDKDGNEISQVLTGEPFYVNVIGNEKYFGQLNVSAYSKNIYTRIYTGGKNQKQYAVLATQNNISKTVTALLENVETGDVAISFMGPEGELISDLKYKLYDEQGKLLQDNDGYAGRDEYRLPLGKYYVEIYDVPKEYLFNNNRYEFDIVEKDKMIEVDVKIDSLESFLDK